MKKWFAKNYRNIIISCLLVPPLLISIISTVHVITWYGVSNLLNWAYVLAIAIEIAALSSLAGIAAKIQRSSLWFVFILVTLIQVIGNVYYSYDYISQQVKIDPAWLNNWIELVQPIIGLFSSDEEVTQIIPMKRLLSVLSGGTLPLISLSFLHMIVKYVDSSREVVDMDASEIKSETPVEEKATVQEKKVEVIDSIKESENIEEKTDEIVPTPIEIIQQQDVVEEKKEEVQVNSKKEENMEEEEEGELGISEENIKPLEKLIYFKFLKILFKNGELGPQDQVMSYVDLQKNIVESRIFANSVPKDVIERQIYDFLVLCNLLKIINVNNENNVILKDYQQARKALSLIYLNK